MSENVGEAAWIGRISCLKAVDGKHKSTSTETGWHLSVGQSIAERCGRFDPDGAPVEHFEVG